MKKLLIPGFILVCSLSLNAQIANMNNEVVSSDEYETTSRTIYYSITGNDTTGNGTSLNPYRSPLRCIQDVKKNIYNCVITISGSGTGNVPIKTDLGTAIGKITAYNSELAFVGTTINDVLTGFTVSKTANRNFAYTLTKTGLTSTADQYIGSFATTTAKTAFYPVGYNAAGTNSFEIEYAHNNLTTSTNLASFGLTWTNPDNIGSIFDFGFKSSKFSQISFTNMNLDGGTTQSLTFYTGGFEKLFVAVKLTARSINIGDAGPGERVSIRFTQCYLVQNSGAGSNFILLLSDPNFFLVRTVAYAAFANQSVMSIGNCKQIKFNNGVYFRGAPAALWGNQGNYSLAVSQAFEYRDGQYLVNPGPGTNIGWQNPSVSANCFFEFQNVASLFHHVPEQDFALIIPNIYGTLPTNIISGGGFTYSLVDLSNKINIVLPGVPTSGTATLVNGTVTINTKAVHSNTLIQLSTKTVSGTPGILSVGTIVNGTSFIINSSSGTDNSSVTWQIIK